MVVEDFCVEIHLEPFPKHTHGADGGLFLTVPADFFAERYLFLNFGFVKILSQIQVLDGFVVVL